MRKKIIRRSLLFILAVLFLFEAWLWDISGVILRQIFKVLHLDRLRVHLTVLVNRLSPWWTLCIFAVPLIVLFPLKLTALYLIATNHVISGITTIGIAQIIGVGISSFIFTVCKPKLMQLAWLKWLYEHVMYWKGKAHAYVAPYMAHVRKAANELRKKALRGKRLSRVISPRFIRRLRYKLRLRLRIIRPASNKTPPAAP